MTTATHTVTSDAETVSTIGSVQMETTRFGPIDVEAERVITFADGMPGFPGARQFTLVPVEGSDNNFYWLQSLDDGDLAFLSTVPWGFFPGYSPALDDETTADLNLTDPDDALVLCLLTIHRDERKITANLLGPVIINTVTRAGRQVVLVDSEFPTQMPLGPAPSTNPSEADDRTDSD